MTTTLAPGSVTEILEAYEFKPGCERTESCPAGCPEATHVVYFFHSPCYPSVQLICTPCADRLRQWREPMSSHCRYCGAPVSEWVKDLMRIEPLP